MVFAPEPVVVAEPTAPAPVLAAARCSRPEPAEPEPVAATVAEPAVVPAPVSPAPEAPDSMSSGWLTVAPDDGVAPMWPPRPSWPARPPLEGGTLAGRRVMPNNNAAALWAASAREVLETGPLPGQAAFVAPSALPSAQPCVGCGLPLSANARFCRRCGSRQG